MTSIFRCSISHSPISSCSMFRYLSSTLAVLLLLVSEVTVAETAAEIDATSPTKNGGIISIDGSLTEIVYALGAQDRLLAVDTTSRYPQAATELPQVGYMRQLSAEGILALRPQWVIASKDAGPEIVFIQLQSAGITVVRIHASDSLDGVLSKVKQVAEVLELEEEGKALTQKIAAQTQAVLKSLPPEKSPSTLFLLGASGRGLMAAGTDTKAQALMDMLHIQNAFSHKGYKPVSAEGALLAAPEVVLVGHTGLADTDSVKQTLAMTPASNHDQIHAIDVGLALGFGPRIAEALAMLKPLVYPQTVMSQVAAE